MDLYTLPFVDLKTLLHDNNMLSNVYPGILNLSWRLLAPTSMTENKFVLNTPTYYPSDSISSVVRRHTKATPAEKELRLSKFFEESSDESKNESLFSENFKIKLSRKGTKLYDITKEREGGSVLKSTENLGIL